MENNYEHDFYRSPYDTSLTEVEKEELEKQLEDSPSQELLLNIVWDLLGRIPVWGYKRYDSSFGDDRLCDCGHPYYRHFDTYEDMAPCGCKYCGCDHWIEPVLNKAKKMSPEAFFEQYLKEIAAYVSNCMVDGRPSDEQFMSQLEQPLGIPTPMIDDFRRSILIKISSKNILQKPFDPSTDEMIGPVLQQICGGG